MIWKTALFLLGFSLPMWSTSPAQRIDHHAEMMILRWQMEHAAEISAKQDAQKIAEMTVRRRSWQKERWDEAHKLLAKQTALIYQLQAQIQLLEEQNIVSLEVDASVNKLLKEIEDGAKDQRKRNSKRF